MRKIIKYNNRKLYDKTAKSYTTLAMIKQLVAVGEEVEVLEKVTGNDITHQILVQSLDTSNISQNQVVDLLRNQNAILTSNVETV